MENKEKYVELVKKLIPVADGEKLSMAYENRNAIYEVVYDTAVSGDEIPILKIGEEYWCLNSSYDPEYAAKAWVNQFVGNDKINSHSVFCVLGMGDGRAIKELLHTVPLNALIIYEPCTEIFWEGLKNGLVQEIMNSGRTFFCVEGITEEIFIPVLHSLLDYTNYRKVICTALPNYDRLFAKDYKKMLEKYKDVAEMVTTVRNTELQRGIESARNMYGLARDIICQYSILQMKNIVREKKMEDIPAILVAAGPSLDKNVDDLKAAEGKAFIMAVDTALNSLLDRGIRPDMTITVDSRKPLKLFEHPDYENIPVVLADQSRVEVVKMNHGRHYYETEGSKYLGQIIKEKTGKMVKSLETGGSVANSALGFLVEMGFATIILIGQDLAYPNGEAHAKDAYKGTEKALNFDDDRFIQVEGNDGNLIWTEGNMNMYRKWIERYVERKYDVQFINATEGGARIHGTKVQTLKEAIAEYCKTEWDKEVFWEGQEPYCTPEEQESLLKELEKIPEELEVLEKDLKKLQEMYKKLENAKEKQVKKTAWLKKKLQEIVDLTALIEKKPVSNLVRPYMLIFSYAVEEEIYDYDEKDSVYSQIQGIIKDGKTLLKGYELGIAEFKKEMHVLVDGE